MTLVAVSTAGLCLCPTVYFAGLCPVWGGLLGRLGRKAEAKHSYDFVQGLDVCRCRAVGEDQCSSGIW